MSSHQDSSCAPGRTRTCDPLLRRQPSEADAAGRNGKSPLRRHVPIPPDVVLSVSYQAVVARLWHDDNVASAVVADARPASATPSTRHLRKGGALPPGPPSPRRRRGAPHERSGGLLPTTRREGRSEEAPASAKPEMKRAMFNDWISEVPSNIVLGPVPASGGSAGCAYVPSTWTFAGLSDWYQAMPASCRDGNRDGTPRGGKTGAALTRDRRADAQRRERAIFRYPPGVHAIFVRAAASTNGLLRGAERHRLTWAAGGVRGVLAGSSQDGTEGQAPLLRPASTTLRVARSSSSSPPGFPRLGLLGFRRSSANRRNSDQAGDHGDPRCLRPSPVVRSRPALWLPVTPRP